ncbi:MAG: LUD domain-containing protein [Pirellulales bacterium]
MSSKQDILARIRRHLPPAEPHPGTSGNWIRYANPEAQFIEVLTSVGGQAAVVPDPTKLREQVLGLSVFEAARRVVCRVPGLELPGSGLGDDADPHSLADVDVAVVAGEFAVAENGAVWAPRSHLGHQGLVFLAQFVVAVVPRRAIVHNMHEAYERLRFEGSGYGVFISGPSKTADIEQSLVIGAHGPRSLTVLLVDA